MTDHYKEIVINQLEAALCMLNNCVTACPVGHWEGKIANDSFRQVVYHTLFFTDLYLSPSEEAFELRELHARGGDERGTALSPGLSKDDTLTYIPLIRQKIHAILAAESAESLQGPSGFSWIKASRAELHLYNLRHVQHHTGQLSAYLRRVDPTCADPKSLPWIRTGWR